MEFPPGAFRKTDPGPDAQFYRSPRFVTHIDDAAVGAVTALYRETIPEGGAVLDLMSSWVSHLPSEASYGRVVGQGMNAAELARNPRLTDAFVQDLNENPRLPLEDEAFDAVLCCVSVQYQQRPVEVWREALRVTKPGGKAIVTFSNRCFPSKAVALWGATDDEGHLRLVSAYLREAGWIDVRAEDRSPSRRSDPLFAVTGTKPL
ncbi:SAM-dependent methyltransferase [bacterium]|nr:MAG: SAM-dependent methyltransferase [bacterium]